MPMADTVRSFAAIAASFLLTGVACAGGTDSDSGPSTSAGNKNVTAPMFRLKIPPGNRKGELIVPSQRPDFDGLRVILGNCTTVKAYREWTVPFPDGAKRAQKQRPAAKCNELFAPGNETQFPSIDFWTNTCFNWRRTRLDARAWEQHLTENGARDRR